MTRSATTAHHMQRPRDRAPRHSVEWMVGRKGRHHWNSIISSRVLWRRLLSVNLIVPRPGRSSLCPPTLCLSIRRTRRCHVTVMGSARIEEPARQRPGVRARSAALDAARQKSGNAPILSRPCRPEEIHQAVDPARWAGLRDPAPLALDPMRFCHPQANRPNGPSSLSPGHRPGSHAPGTTGGLKGRNSPCRRRDTCPDRCSTRL